MRGEGVSSSIWLEQSCDDEDDGRSQVCFSALSVYSAHFLILPIFAGESARADEHASDYLGDGAGAHLLFHVPSAERQKRAIKQLYIKRAGAITAYTLSLTKTENVLLVLVRRKHCHAQFLKFIMLNHPMCREL